MKYDQKRTAVAKIDPMNIRERMLPGGDKPYDIIADLIDTASGKTGDEHPFVVRLNKVLDRWQAALKDGRSISEKQFNTLRREAKEMVGAEVPLRERQVAQKLLLDRFLPTLTSQHVSELKKIQGEVKVTPLTDEAIAEADRRIAEKSGSVIQGEVVDDGKTD